MSSIYTSLQVSPKKKRCPPREFDESTLTPKRLRTKPMTPPRTIARRPSDAFLSTTQLPGDFERLFSIFTALQHAVSHALATCAISPTPDSGYVRNVLNHLSLTTYAGLMTSFKVDDLKRLCWLWEWDGKTWKNEKENLEDANPFLDPVAPTAANDWSRGAMGLVVSSTSHYSKRERMRVPAYGIGIEVEIDLDKDMAGGMAAVARWTAAADKRRNEFRTKLESWANLHACAVPIPAIPLADLPPLFSPQKMSSLTRTLASCSPGASGYVLPDPLLSPSRSPKKSLANSVFRGAAIPFPMLTADAASSAKNNSNNPLFPQTPRRGRLHPPHLPTPQQTPISKSSSDDTEPCTPSRQRGASAATAPVTPSTSRRQALYERIRQKSLVASPMKASNCEISGGKLTRDQMLKMAQDEMRRRCLLGRLGGVAESVWMLFSVPATGLSKTLTARKRKALPLSDVVTAVIKSSPVPISTAEAKESLLLLSKLCPFFIKGMTIGNAEWLEMPASCAAADIVGDPVTRRPVAPVAPGSNAKLDSAEVLVNRSPRRVRKETGGLREVREIIRKELELQD